MHTVSPLPVLLWASFRKIGIHNIFILPVLFIFVGLGVLSIQQQIDEALGLIDIRGQGLKDLCGRDNKHDKTII